VQPLPDGQPARSDIKQVYDSAKERHVGRSRRLRFAVTIEPVIHSIPRELSIFPNNAIDAPATRSNKAYTILSLALILADYANTQSMYDPSLETRDRKSTESRARINYDLDSTQGKKKPRDALWW